MGVEFHDYSVQVKEAMSDRMNAVLEECAGEIESQTKRNSRVDTGKTKNSFQHKVVESEHIASRPSLASQPSTSRALVASA